MNTPPPAVDAPVRVDDLSTVPPVIRAWIVQLLAKDFVDLVRQVPDLQMDVRLSAHGGRVRRRPAVVLNGGSQDMVSPTEMLGELPTPVAG